MEQRAKRMHLELPFNGLDFPWSKTERLDNALDDNSSGKEFNPDDYFHLFHPTKKPDHDPTED